MKYKPYYWVIVWVLTFGGAWLTDKTGSHWWMIACVGGCALTFLVRKLEDRDEKEYEASLYWDES